MQYNCNPFIDIFRTQSAQKVPLPLEFEKIIFDRRKEGEKKKSNSFHRMMYEKLSRLIFAETKRKPLGFLYSHGGYVIYHDISLKRGRRQG